MGLFSKPPKPNPKLIVAGVEITFHRDHEWWEFAYRGNQFCAYDLTFSVPSQAELDAMVDTIDSLRQEMRSRIQQGLKEWGDSSQLDDGESYTVRVDEFAKEKTFTVTWSDGASWGDMGVDFTIKDQAIIDEGWGD